MVRNAGTGLWESTTALGKVQRRYFDTATEQAGYFGTLEEAAGPAIVTLRLKIEDRKITEAEWVINRKGDPGLGPLGGGQANAAFYDPEYLLAHAPAERVVPKNERHTRSELVAIANSYFDSLSAHDGKIMMAHPGCVRIENGALTTQRPLPAGGESDCTAEGAMRNIYAVTARRYPIVDEEAGAVSGSRALPALPGRRHAAQPARGVVLRGRGQDPLGLRRDVLPHRRRDGAELAAVRRQLAGEVGSYFFARASASAFRAPARMPNIP